MNISTQPILDTLQPGKVLTIEENIVFVGDKPVDVLEIGIEPIIVGWCGDAPLYEYFEDEPF